MLVKEATGDVIQGGRHHTATTQGMKNSPYTTNVIIIKDMWCYETLNNSQTWISQMIGNVPPRNSYKKNVMLC